MKGTELILIGIERLIYEGGEGNFLIINVGEDYYIQLICNRGDYEMYAEAVSNYYIDNDEALLDEATIEKLLQLGWQTPDEEGNFHLTHPVDSENSRQTLAQLISTTAEVYNVGKLVERDFSLNLK